MHRFGELFTLWSVRLAVLFYVSALASRLTSSNSAHRLLISRGLWTIGFLFFVVHVGCAFQFYHAWSHRLAWEATARQTYEYTGMNSGSGLYSNYLFAAVWGLDSLWWWCRPSSYQTRRRLIEFLVQGFLAFITFNATVIFASGATRWLGLAATFLLSIAAVRKWWIVPPVKSPAQSVDS